MMTETVQLTEADIPGACLSEPMVSHTMPQLRWWLLCRGVRAPTSWNKQKLLIKIEQTKSDKLPLVDVDGSYMYRKQQQMTDSAGGNAPIVDSATSPPTPPLSGWECVTECNVKDMGPKIPTVTSGTLYTYLACGVGSMPQGAFRALTRGYNHWASGRMDRLKINTNHPLYCHVRGTATPSMKPGSYQVYLLLSRKGQFSDIVTATCECAAGKSASCTHVSALLHALVAITTSGKQPIEVQSADEVDEEEAQPVTSYLCQWKVPKNRKESNVPMSGAVFEKHNFQKQLKRKRTPTEDFDPRPLDCRGNVKTRHLPEFLEAVRNESLGISLLLDPRYCSSDANDPPIDSVSINVPETAQLKRSISAFKESLKLPSDKLREIEHNTRDQHLSDVWLFVRRYRLTASRFGEILHRRPSTPPDRLVLSILQPKSFSSAATSWGIHNESSAIEAYVKYQQQQKGIDCLTVSPCGFLIDENHPFLGASPDGAVYDPTSTNHPFGFIEVKCPYSLRNHTPIEAGHTAGFFCCVHSVGNLDVLRLRQNHRYYAQVQGQMAVGERKWCDFIVYTTKGISVERIDYDQNYWKITLLPKLENFYDNCLAPEIVSPIHALGLPLRDLSKIV